jgi:hypothetical protein
MRLNEIKVDKDAIAAICKQFNIFNVHIDDDGCVSTLGSVFLNRSTFKKFPVKFGKINGDFQSPNSVNLKTLTNAPLETTGCFEISTSKSLISLIGGPTKVGRSYYIYDSPNLTSLEGIAEDIGEDFLMMGCSKINKLSHIKSIKGTLYFDGHLVSNVLYVLQIKNLSGVDTNIPDLNEILVKYLDMPIRDRDIMECQEEMISAGFGKMANLK